MKFARDWPLYLVGIVVFLWTIIPIYHLLIIAITPQQEAVASGLFPKNPTLQNFELVLGAKHNMVQHFWSQLGTSVFIAVMHMMGKGPHIVKKFRKHGPFFIFIP